LIGAEAPTPLLNEKLAKTIVGAIVPVMALGEGDDDAGQLVVVLAQCGGECLGVGFGFCEEADSIEGLVLYCHRSDEDRLLISGRKVCCQRIRTGAVLECTYLRGKDGAAWGAGTEGAAQPVSLNGFDSIPLWSKFDS